MACKLVAIYQKHHEDAGEAELTNEKINGLITTPLKYYAKYDFSKLNQKRKDDDEGEHTEQSWNPQDSLTDSKPKP